MLCSTKQLEGFSLAARDGEVGQVREVYFDDERWVIRHLVVSAGEWLAGRDVLISPHSIKHLDHGGRRLEVDLSRQQIENAPGIDTDKPVSRQQEIPYNDYYGYPNYWGGVGIWGMAAFPMAGVGLAVPPRDADVPTEVAEMEAAERAAADPHLRSSSEVKGYDIEASDASIGHIDDFLFDERSWAIRYAVVDTHNWLPDRLVLIAPQSIESVNWNEGKVRVRLTREAVKASPPYDRRVPLSEEQDRRTQHHFDSWA